MSITIFTGFTGALPTTVFIFKNDSNAYFAVSGVLKSDMTYDCELYYSRSTINLFNHVIDKAFAKFLPMIKCVTALVKESTIDGAEIPLITTRSLALEKYLGVIPEDFGGSMFACYSFLYDVGLSKVDTPAFIVLDINSASTGMSLPVRDMDSKAAWDALNNDPIFKVDGIDPDEEDSIKKSDHYKELDYYATHEQPGVKSIQMFLAGPPSSGKTASVSVFAKAYNLPFFGITCGPELSIDDATGQLTPTTTSAGLLHWYDILTNFARVISVENGVGLIDEVAALNHGLAHQLNSLLEYPYCITVRGVTYYRHPKSIIFVAGNSGLGNGRSDFLPSLISRLYTISVPELNVNDVKPYMEKIWSVLGVSQATIDKALEVLFTIKDNIIPLFSTGCKSSYGPGITFRTIKAAFGQFVGAKYYGEVRPSLEVADKFIHNNTYNGDYANETYVTSLAMIEKQCIELDKLVASSGLTFDSAWLNPAPVPTPVVIDDSVPADPVGTTASNSILLEGLVKHSQMQDPNKV